MEKHDGIFTPYNEIEGRTFKILDIELSDAGVEKNTIFALQSEEGLSLIHIYMEAAKGEKLSFSSRFHMKNTPLLYFSTNR